MALFGRRPPQRVDSIVMPASEKLHISGLVDLDLWGGWAYLLGRTLALTVEYASGRY
jgi:hypothetical protein